MLRRTLDIVRVMLVLALVAGAVATLWIAVIWGRQLQRDAPEVFLGAAPLVGRNFRDGWDWRFGWGLVGAGAVTAATSWAALVGWFERVRLRTVTMVTSLAAGAFATLLASTDGEDGVLYGARHDTEYLANLATAPPAGAFVRGFVANIDDYTVHVRGHPPGFVLLLKMLDAIGWGGAWPTAMVSVLSAVALPAAVIVAVWAIAGPTWARRCAPFLVVAPYAIWMVTSADAFFTALGAWGVAFVAIGIRQHRWRAALAGGIGGLLLSTMLFMTYGAALYLLIPVAVAIAGWMSRRPGTLPVFIAAVTAAAVVTLSWWAAGFWWFDGLAATRNEYWEGTAQFRIWNYFIVANLAAALLAVGPATFFGAIRLRSRSMWILVGSALAAMLIANMSQLSKGEVERIWLLFFPWLAIAGASFAAATRGRSQHSRWPWATAVAAQGIAAVILQAALVSKW